MSNPNAKHPNVTENDQNNRVMSPAAQRALAEAAARRKAQEEALATESGSDVAKNGQREIDGPKGPEPVRYGDWEIKGQASDF